MHTQIVKLINDFEHGRLSRRQLIRYLTGMFAASLGGATVAFADQEPERAPPSPANSAPTFDATDLNHIALTVTDVQRSQKWYEKHLGLKPKGQEGFLTTGKGWLALFQGEKAGLNHYCYSIANYDPDDAVARLNAAGLTFRREDRRVYFPDPDGIECQVASA
ncbi:MAG: VOC family protein [Nitrospirota bacterium]|jgi:catechol 2,3-dioxygenase-like lactoylglutathione lyase family enzyme